MSVQSPLLHVPTRTTDEAELSSPIKDYIRSHYEQEPSKFKSEINTLHRLRQDCRGAGKDITGRDILYRYYGQLELLDLRFPIDENHVKILFTWYDSFTSKECSQYSIAFEKASVIYNIGATCTSIAALQNRFEPEGLKLAFNYFQAAAGLFSFINENFLHAPSVDMSRDSIKTLTELALAQAQECFLERVVGSEKKKGNLVSKLCAQLAFMYSNIMDGFNLDTNKGQFDKAWVELVKVKSKYFNSVAYYHRYLQLELDTMYGTGVAYLTQAETLAKEAHKLASSFASSFPNFTVSTMTNEAGNTSSTSGSSSASTALQDLAKTHLNLVSEKLVGAIKDNDLIYHDSVPPVDSLEPLEKLNAVKAIPFGDLLPNGQADVAKIVGPDIFIKLVPLAVHEAASMYSEEKAQMVRKGQYRCKMADDEIEATVESLGLAKTLNKLKLLLKDSSQLGEEMPLPPEIIEWSIGIQNDESKSSKNRTEDLLAKMSGLKPGIQEIMSELPGLLEKEQHECEAMRVKYLEAWTQEPSSQLTATIRSELKAHKESFEKAAALDGPIANDLSAYKDVVTLLNRPLDKVEATFVQEVVKAVPVTKDASLLDSNKSEGMAGLGEQMNIEKVEALLQHLRQLKKERGEVLAEISAKVKTDDISSLLLLNKNKEKQIFETELTKYANLRTKITDNLEAHRQLLTDLSTEFQKLCKTSKGMAVLDAREKKKIEVLNEWRSKHERYKNAKDGLKRGSGFYTGLKRSMDELKAKVVQFVNRRLDERTALVKKIENDLAEKGQQAIREQLQKLQVSQPVPEPPRVTAPVPSQPPVFNVAHYPAPLKQSPLSPLGVPTFTSQPVSPGMQAPPGSPQAAYAPSPQEQSFSNAYSAPPVDESFYSRPSMPPGQASHAAYQPNAPPPLSPVLSQTSPSQSFEPQGNQGYSYQQGYPPGQQNYQAPGRQSYPSTASPQKYELSGNHQDYNQKETYVPMQPQAPYRPEVPARPPMPSNYSVRPDTHYNPPQELAPRPHVRPIQPPAPASQGQPNNTGYPADQYAYPQQASQPGMYGPPNFPAQQGPMQPQYPSRPPLPAEYAPPRPRPPPTLPARPEYRPMGYTGDASFAQPPVTYRPEVPRPPAPYGNPAPGNMPYSGEMRPPQPGYGAPQIPPKLPVTQPAVPLRPSVTGYIPQYASTHGPPGQYQHSQQGQYQAPAQGPYYPPGQLPHSGHPQQPPSQQYYPGPPAQQAPPGYYSGPPPQLSQQSQQAPQVYYPGYPPQHPQYGMQPPPAGEYQQPAYPPTTGHGYSQPPPGQYPVRYPPGRPNNLLD